MVLYCQYCRYKMRLFEPQNNDKETKKSRLVKLPEGQKDIKKVLHYQSLSYIPKLISVGLSSSHHNNLLADCFWIEKPQKLIARKCQYSILQNDVEVYIKCCDVCSTSKAVCNKFYGNLQSLLILTHLWKNLFIDFLINLPIPTDQKNNS